jgi:hypothetical protein
VIVDVHAHYISPGAFDTVRRAPDTYGVRLLPGEGVRLQIGDEPPTRPLLPALYTSTCTRSFSPRRASTPPCSVR